LGFITLVIAYLSGRIGTTLRKAPAFLQGLLSSARMVSICVIFMIRFFFLIHCRVDPTRGAMYGAWTEMARYEIRGSDHGQIGLVSAD